MRLFAILTIIAVGAAISIGIAVANNEMYSINGSGMMKTEQRDLRDFTSVSVSGAIIADVHAGAEYSVKIEADDNMLQYVKTSVSGKVLSVSMKDGFSFRNGSVHVSISMPQVEGLEASGATTLNASDVKGAALKLEVSGASHATIAGQVNRLDCDVSGASTLAAEWLVSKNAAVNCSGASNAHVHADESLDIDASGASHVSYSGNATNVNNQTSGVSSIDKE